MRRHRADAVTRAARRALAPALALVLALGAAPARAHPGDHGRALSGVVVTAETGRPVAGVTVRLDGTALSATTDAAGAFHLPGAPRTEGVLVVEDGRLRVPVPAGEAPVTLTVTVAWAEAPEYGHVIRAPPVAPGTASTTHLPARTLASAPRRTAEDALRLAPGVALVQHGAEGKGHQLFLRGIDALHGASFAVTADGLPLNEPSNIHAHGYLDLSLLIPEVVARVDVFKGPFRLEEGPFAVAGAADYRLGVPTDALGWRAAYTAGTTGRHRLLGTWSPAEGDGGRFVAVEALTDDGFGARRATRRGTVLGRWRLLDDPRRGQLWALGGLGLGAFELPGLLRADAVADGTLSPTGAHDPAGRGASMRGLAALDYRWASGDAEVRALLWGGHRQLTLVENFTGWLADPVHGDRREGRHRASSLGLSLTARGPLGPGLAWVAGAGAAGDHLEQAEYHLGPASERLGTRRATGALEVLWHGWAGLRWRPVAAWSAEAGLRLDGASVAAERLLDPVTRGGGTVLAASPRLSLRWAPAEAWHLFAAYGRGLRPPEAQAYAGWAPVTDAGELAPTGRPAMTASDALELGVRWSPDPALSLSAAVFGTFIARESVFDHVSGANLALNATGRLGVELAATWRPTYWLDLTADLTATRARFLASGAAVPFAPPLVAALRGVLTHPSGLSAGLHALALGPRPLPFGARGSALLSLDATVGYAFDHLLLHLELVNPLGLAGHEGEYVFASHWQTDRPPSRLPALHLSPLEPRALRLTATVRY